MTNTEKARSGVGYLMKYVAKLDGDSQFPKGLRLYGVGGLDQQSRAIRTWHNLPEWAKREHGVGDLCRVRSRLVNKHTGEFLKPMYAPMWRPGPTPYGPGIIELHQLREMPERWHDGPYSSVSFEPAH